MVKSKCAIFTCARLHPSIFPLTPFHHHHIFYPRLKLATCLSYHLYSIAYAKYSVYHPYPKPYWVILQKMAAETVPKKRQLAWSPEEKARLIHLRGQNPDITWRSFIRYALPYFASIGPSCCSFYVSFDAMFDVLIPPHAKSWQQPQPSPGAELPAVVIVKKGR